ncbi:hypothetical protein EXN66_Car013915 [Channa argus]|uniref:Uncharacterized protein n=1 Tax=Channa argus TaxID=215402 RepID=A0A6G1Q751_CHAAH|nr:hypothetical protein EXN66_Car013915 [Channa argus]
MFKLSIMQVIVGPQLNGEQKLTKTASGANVSLAETRCTVPTPWTVTDSPSNHRC